MASVRQKDTGPEMAVRRMLHRMGYRYSLHRRNLPGRPDLVFGPRHKIVFVHGCFWHDHDCRKGRLPTSRVAYKVSKNKARDVRNVRDLADRGWKMCVVWECETVDLDFLRQRLVRFLDGGAS